VLDDRIRPDVRWQGPGGGATEDRPDAERLRAAHVGDRVVADHERLTRTDGGELEGPIEHRAMRLPPAHVVRGRDAVDRVSEAGTLPVARDLRRSAGEGVRHQHDPESLTLAPAHRIRGSGHRGRDEIERNGTRGAQPVDIDVAFDPPRGEPLLVPTIRLLLDRVRLLEVRLRERVEPVPMPERTGEVLLDEGNTRLHRRPILDERVADIEERGPDTHANIVSTVLDFDQLAFIEKWRQRASRGVVIALDGTRGDIVVTIRAGELGERLDLRGRDATGAVRKARLSIGDRVTMAIEYTAKDPAAGAGAGVSGDLVAPGAVVEGTVSETGELTVVDCGLALLVKGDSLPAKVGDVVRFTIADEGRAYLIPTR
jgi:hypothetical protein